MSAPTRIVYADRNAYRLDPYIRDAGGRFATAPLTTPPPIALLEATGHVRAVVPGSVWVAEDTDARNYWRVRCIRDADGTYRVLYLED